MKTEIELLMKEASEPQRAAAGPLAQTDDGWQLKSECLRSIKKMSERVKEVTDNSFEREVLQAKKPVLVDFWAEWCGPCRLLAPTIEAIAEEHSSSVSVVKLNV